MPSAIKQLSDEKLEQVRHMIRRGAHTALQIADFVGGMDGTDHAREMVINRYKQSAEYKRWLDRWENQDVQFKKDIAMQKQRFEFLQSLVGNSSDDNALNAVSKSLQARLLTIAAEASDEELREAKWVKNVIKIVQEQNKISKNSQVEQLKQELAKLSKAGGKAVDGKVLVAKVDEIMGLKK